MSFVVAHSPSGIAGGGGGSRRRLRTADANILMVTAVVRAPRQVPAAADVAVEVHGAHNVFQPNGPGAAAERLNLPAGGGAEAAAHGGGLAVCAKKGL